MTTTTERTRYTIMRDCCTSGQCTTCYALPRGQKMRVEQTHTNDPESARRIRDGWSAYNATIVESGPAADARTPFERIESWILDNGGRMVGSSGRVGKQSAGLTVGYYLTGAGKPVILQTMREGGVEVFVRATSSPRIDDTIAALDAHEREAPASSLRGPDPLAQLVDHEREALRRILDIWVDERGTIGTEIAQKIRAKLFPAA